MASPYLASLASPTPPILARSASDDGCCSAISRSVASWKITYAGTPCSLAAAARQARSCSNTPAAAAGSSAAGAAAERLDLDLTLAGVCSGRSRTWRCPDKTAPLASVSARVP